jgi:hypothetical protein
MKKVILTLVAIGCLCLTQATQAADKEAKTKTKTITGTALCAKCALKETDACQNAIQVEKNGKKTTYYLVQNDVSKKFHDQICKEPKKVKATGTIKKVNGKNEMTPTDIELVK